MSTSDDENREIDLGESDSEYSIELDSPTSSDLQFIANDSEIEYEEEDNENENNLEGEILHISSNNRSEISQSNLIEGNRRQRLRNLNIYRDSLIDRRYINNSDADSDSDYIFEGDEGDEGDEEEEFSDYYTL